MFCIAAVGVNLKRKLAVALISPDLRKGHSPLDDQAHSETSNIHLRRYLSIIMLSLLFSVLSIILAS
ncbi:hypothetical protein BS47DRAFT_1193459 [Hydnum rufescens UP504]|uniref:Uncharacterized protein n=1 Tax=Hydnum rufescens UP504 TaxID=1448309 RepID=A0A9P6AUU5_9AGAM|nr:hypothetical protein BS47DRAFT_1193459 [Hydnum rufescens UP504]